jgi:hypothetical protein
MSKKKVRLPPFIGSHKQFHMWWARFTAYAAVYKLKEALVVGGEPDMPENESDVLDFTTDEVRTEAAAKNRNATAMTNLILALQSEAMLGLFFKAKTAEWSSGLAHLVVSALYKKYELQDTIARVEQIRRLCAEGMKRNEGPATCSVQIGSIENKFNMNTNKAIWIMLCRREHHR